MQHWKGNSELMKKIEDAETTLGSLGKAAFLKIPCGRTNVGESFRPPTFGAARLSRLFASFHHDAFSGSRARKNKFDVVIFFKHSSNAFTNL
jgi:hypothetical protein